MEANFHNEKEYNEGMHAELVSLVDPGYEAFRETNGHIYAAYESVIKYVFT